MKEPIKVLVKRNFLSEPELRGLIDYTLSHESDFTAGAIVPNEASHASTVPEYRRARVLFELGEYRSLITDRILASLPGILKALRRESFPLWYVDTQITASNDGDFYRAHRDNGSLEPIDIPLRQVSFVYYFHSEPKAFTGGLLRFCDVVDGETETQRSVTLKTIAPRQNSVVFFPSSYEHEVQPVNCPSRKFAHSRFTLNGWVIREPDSAQS